MGDQIEIKGDQNRLGFAPNSGIDWSIFNDSEEDTFGWLLRNNSSSSGAVSVGLTGNSTENMDIIPLDDVEMDRMMASADVPQHQIAKGQTDGINTATVAARVPTDIQDISTERSEVCLLSRQIDKNLAASLSTRPTAKWMSTQSNVASLDDDNVNVNDIYQQNEELLEKELPDKNYRSFKLEMHRGGKKRAVKVNTSKEKVSPNRRSTGDKDELNASRAMKSTQRPKQQKRKQVLPTIADCDADDDLGKKQLRRVKNLVSVREFRKRKMKQQEQNEVRLRRLEAENMDLKMRLKIGKEAIVSEQREKQQIKEQMRDMLQRNTNEQEIANFLNMYKVTYSDYGPKRREKLRFHLLRIRDLLLPTQVTKLSLYSVEQGVDMRNRDHVIKEDPMFAPESATATTSLWGILADEIMVSDDQQRQILKRRTAIKKVRDDLNHTLSIVKKLEDVADEKNTALEAQVAQLQQILTPSQATKFIIWVKENPAFMYMLDKLVDSTLQHSSNSAEE